MDVVSPGATRYGRAPSPRRPAASDAGTGGGVRLSPEVARAATALRAEGKELLHVLQHLRQRCGGAVLRAPAGREVTIRITFGPRGGAHVERAK